MTFPFSLLVLLLFAFLAYDGPSGSGGGERMGGAVPKSKYLSDRSLDRGKAWLKSW